MIRSLADPFVLLWRHRHVLATTTVTEFRRTYAGSVLGLFWLFVGPAMMVGLYAMVYALIFRVRPADLTQGQYVIHVVTGLLPFLGFSAALGVGALSLTSNKLLLLSTVFPAELIPLRSVLLSFGASAMGLALAAVLAVFVSGASVTWLAIPVVLVLLMLFTAGLVWVLALATIVLRDIQQLLQPLIFTLLIVTPIAYTPSMVPATLKPILFINPLAPYVATLQRLMTMGELPGPGVMAFLVVTSLVSFCGGYAIFTRAKSAFIDYA